MVKIKQKMKSPPEGTKALSTSGKIMKGPPAGTEALSTSIRISVVVYTCSLELNLVPGTIAVSNSSNTMYCCTGTYYQVYEYE